MFRGTVGVQIMTGIRSAACGLRSRVASLVLALACLSVAVPGLPSRAYGVPPAIDAPLVWSNGSDEGAGDADRDTGRAPARRIAVLLIDRSDSMRGEDPGAGGTSRWQLVLANLARCLDQLERSTPGIEVEIRFFDERLDCEDPMRFVLSGKPLPGGRTRSQEAVEAVTRLGQPPWFSGTALYQSISIVASDLSDRFAKSNCDWGFFAVYSDGKDTSSSAEFKENGPSSYREAARRLGATLAPSGGKVTVVPVGPEALSMVRDGIFAGFEAGDIASSLPKPPPPPCRVELGLAPSFDGVVTTGRLLRSGDSVDVSIRAAASRMEGACAVADVLGATELEVRVADNAPFRIEGSTVLPGAGGTVRCVPTGDPENGTVLRLEVTPRGKPGSSLIVRKAPLKIAASFRPAVAPPDSQSWKLSIPQFVRVGSRATLSVDNLDEKFKIAWSLDGVAKSTQPSFSHLFDRAGVVTGVLEAESADGKKGRREFRLEVIDGSFTIGLPARASIGKACELSVREAKATGSTYEWEVDGVRSSGEGLSLKPSVTGEIPIRCTAITAKGGFKFEAFAVLPVLGRPRVVIAEPDSLREGAASVTVVCRTFDIEGDARIRLSLQGREVGAKQPAPFEGGGRAEFVVPLGQAFWTSAIDVVELKAGVVGESLGNVEDVREIPVIAIEGLSVQLRSPKPGTVVAFGVNTKLELEVGAPDAAVRDLVQSMRIRVLDENSKSVLLGDDSGAGIERAAPDFSVSIQPDPGVHRPPFRVEAQLSGVALKSRAEWLLAGEIGAELAKAQFTITTVDGKALEAVAYQPLSVQLNGVPVGEKVTVEWSLDGTGLSGDAPAATLPGTEPGQHEVAAVVVRGNGARENVGPVSLLCKSSLRLEPASSAIAWEVGSPPSVPVEIRGSSQEMEMIESVRWTDATPLDGSKTAAKASFAAAGEGGEVAPLQVTAEISFRGGVKPPERVSATYTPMPAAAEITRFDVTVGGRSPSDRAGGAVLVVLETKGVVGRSEVHYSYTPSEKALQRGFEAVFDQRLPMALVIDDDADGSWTFEARVSSYGGKDQVTKAAAFENERRLDWFRFGVFVAVTWFGLSIFLWLASDNAGLWWGVRFCRADARSRTPKDADFTRPYVFWRGRSTDRPRWNLFTKRAAAPITSVAGFSSRPQWRWFVDRLLRRDGASDAEMPPSKVREELENQTVRWTNRQSEPLSKLGDGLVDGAVDVDPGSDVRTECCSPPERGDRESEPVYFQRKDTRRESSAYRFAWLLWFVLVIGFPLSLGYGVFYIL